MLQGVLSADEKDENEVTDRLDRMSISCDKFTKSSRFQEVMMTREKVEYAASAWAGRKLA